MSWVSKQTECNFDVVFEIPEEQNYSYAEIQPLYIFYKLCREYELDIKIEFQRHWKLMDPPIKTNSFAIMICASGDKEAIKRLKETWKSVKDNKEDIKELEIWKKLRES